MRSALAVGGGLNYVFIKTIGSALLAFEDDIFKKRLDDGAGPALILP